MVTRPCSLFNSAIVTFGTRDVFLGRRVAYLDWRRLSFCIPVESFVKLVVTVDLAPNPLDRKDLVHAFSILHSVCGRYVLCSSEEYVMGNGSKKL